MVFKMRGNPAKRGEIQGTVGHASALKQGLMDPEIEVDPKTGIPIDPWGQTGEQTEEEKRAEEIRRIREDMKNSAKKTKYQNPKKSGRNGYGSRTISTGNGKS